MSENTVDINRNWFVHVEWVVVLVTLLGGFYTLDGKIERQGQRTDRLYEMWLEENQSFHAAMKDFHGRLCSIEEKNKGK